VVVLNSAVLIYIPWERTTEKEQDYPYVKVHKKLSGNDGKIEMRV